MNSQSLKLVSVQSLVQAFAVSAGENGRAWEKAKPRLANKQYALQENIYAEIKSRGPEAQRSMLNLLTNSNPYVRCLSAAYILEFDPQAAESVLVELEKLHGLVGHNAEMTLKVWRNGELRFP